MWQSSHPYSGAVTPQKSRTNISSAIINSISEQTYSGSEIAPEPVVTLGGVTLIKDQDFTLSYTNNINAGTATITIAGIGAYEGTQTVNFDITYFEYSIKSAPYGYGAYITGYTGESTSVTIPAQLGGVDVVSVELINHGLTSLNVSGATVLKYLGCGSNNLSSLDVSNNAALEYLSCGNNLLTSIDVSNCPNLQILYADNNDFATLSIINMENLRSLMLNNNELTSLDVSGCDNLSQLSVMGNQFTSFELGISGNSEYGLQLYVSNNPLTSLDVSGVTNLSHLGAWDCELASLDVSNNSALTGLYCTNNNLISLDISNNSALTNLGCANNHLTSLDISNNSALTYLECQNNFIANTSELIAWLGISGHSGTITPQKLINVSPAIIIPIGDQTYTGSEITPEPVVTLSGVTLVKDQDYTLSYSNNIDSGTATITITGIGAYEGSVNVGFAIVSAPSKPLSLVTMAGNAQVELSWQAPSVDGGSAVLGYNIYRDDAKVNTSLITTTSYTDTGLTNGTTYSYGVSAANAAGEGVKCDVVSATPLIGWAPKLTTTRLSGGDRFGTMSAIAIEGYTSAKTVIIATAFNYPDALAASGLAGIKGAPILLTDGATLSSQVIEQIYRLGATEAIIVGGEGVISAAVKDALVAKGLTVKRAWGADRIATSLEIFKAGSGWSKTAIVATGFGFADALSISPYAYANKSPIFLTGGGSSNLSLSQATIDAIKSGGFTRILLVGGLGVVSDEVKAQLGSSFNYERLGEADRYKTSARIAEFAVADGVLHYDNMAIATGSNFPDALAGSTLCGLRESVLLLIDDNSDTSRFCINNIIQKYGKEISSRVYFLGGEAVVTPSLRDKVIQARNSYV